MNGLTSAQAAALLREHGPNALAERDQESAFALLLAQLKSPLLLLLSIAAVVSASVGDALEASMILLMLLASALLGFAQEHRASRAVAALRRRLTLDAAVLRDGVETRVPATQIVPGDVLVLAAGARIAADAELLDAKDLFLNEALLTGESLPVEKSVGAPLYQGTSVHSGEGHALAKVTGKGTRFNAIVHKLSARPPETAFERALREFGALLVRLATLIVLVVFAANVLLARPAVESLLFALALAVGMTPELLPTILTVTLASGARRLAAEGVVVRRLNAIETLGSMDVLLTDKTGTLTLGRVELQDAVDADGQASARVLELAGLNAALRSGASNPLDEAILAKASSAAGVDKLDEIPYDFERRRVSVVARLADGSISLITKGAAASVLSICELDAARRAELLARVDAWGADGIRALAVASRRSAPQGAWTHADEKGFALEGFLLFLDPPSPTAKGALVGLRDLHVDVKMVTGDSAAVAAHVARNVGLPADRVVRGADIARMGDTELRHMAARASVFAEIDPGQKERILGALQREGHVVGFLGDGINDAPALHAADVGISVEGAADVARESADIVLVSAGLDVIQRGVERGRRTFANTVKYIFITSSANFGNMLSMAAATLVLPFLPLLASQIILNNFLSDVPALFIANDRVDEGWVRKPYRWETRIVRRVMIGFGLLSSAFDALTLTALWLLVGAAVGSYRTGWFVESLLTEIAVIFVMRTYGPFYRSRVGRALLSSAILVALAAIALPFTPIAPYFDLVPLDARTMAFVLGITLAYAFATELLKRALFRGTIQPPRSARNVSP